MTLIHPMNNPNFFIVEVLQCLVDKYQITYQNIWEEVVVRPHLVELEHYKFFQLLKSLSDLIRFLHKKKLLVITVHEREFQK